MTIEIQFLKEFSTPRNGAAYSVGDIATFGDTFAYQLIAFRIAKLA